MAKDKKKKDGKKREGAKSEDRVAKVRTQAKKASKRVAALAENPLVVDVVAAALVAAAAALKDSTKARRLAESVGDELAKLETAGSEGGSAMWQLALDIGRRALKTVTEEQAPKKRKT